MESSSSILGIASVEYIKDLKDWVEFNTIKNNILAVDLYTGDGDHLEYCSQFANVICFDIFRTHPIDQMVSIQHRYPNVFPIRLSVDNAAKKLIDRRVDLVHIAGEDIYQVLHGIEQWKHATKTIVFPSGYNEEVQYQCGKYDCVNRGLVSGVCFGK